MNLTRGEMYLKMVKSLAKAKPESIQENFFKKEIASIIADSEYHELTKEDIELLKNAQYRK